MTVKDRVRILLPEKNAKPALTEAIEMGFTRFATPGDAKDLEGLARVEILTLTEAGLQAGARVVAPCLSIGSVEEQEQALRLAGRAEAFLVDAADWRIIPYENLIAAYRRKGTRLLVIARDADDARLLLETLETGVDEVLLPAAHARAVARRLEGAEGTEALARARVTAVRPVGSGDRACLDTASLLAEDEGVLTGSASGGLFLVASEARESGYVASRPFRVNAGAVHAYVLAPGGRTRYLSELRAGDEVLVCDREGHTRGVVLGRVKIERRPLLLIEAETAEGRKLSTLLQNAETIRVVGPEGTHSVVALAPGDEVLVRLDEGGRHFGMAVDETLVER